MPDEKCDYVVRLPRTGHFGLVGSSPTAGRDIRSRLVRACVQRPRCRSEAS